MESPKSGSLEPDALKLTAKGVVPLVGFAVNAATGAETLIGDTGANYVGDLDFQPVPEPATYSLLSLGLGGLIARWRKSRSGKHPI